MPAPPAYTRRGQPLPGPSSLPDGDGQVASYNADKSFAGWITPVNSGGLPGGQTIHGGTGPAEILTLSPTSDATRGKVRIGGTSRLVYDDLNIRLGLGTENPVSRLHVQNGTVLIRRDVDGGSAFINILRGGVRRWGLHIDTTASDGALYWLSDGSGATYAVRPTVMQSRATFAIQSPAGGNLAGYHVDGNLMTELSESASTPGSVTRRLPVYDAERNLLGYIPIYDAIT